MEYNGVELTIRLVVSDDTPVSDALIELENKIADFIDAEFKDRLLLLGGSGNYINVNSKQI